MVRAVDVVDAADAADMVFKLSLTRCIIKAYLTVPRSGSADEGIKSNHRSIENGIQWICDR